MLLEVALERLLMFVPLVFLNVPVLVFLQVECPFWFLWYLGCPLVCCRVCLGVGDKNICIVTISSYVCGQESDSVWICIAVI